MDEQNRYPHTPAGETPDSSGPRTRPAQRPEQSTDQTVEQNLGPYDEHTRPIPPYQQNPGYAQSYPPAYPRPTRRRTRSRPPPSRARAA